MKILFFIAVWINIVFFLWESNFGNIDTVYQDDANVTKQIFLQSELSNNEVAANQIVTAENKINKLAQDQLPKSSEENVVIPEIKNKNEILQKSSKSVKALPNKKVSVKESLNKQSSIENDKNDTSIPEESSNKEITLYAGHCYQVGPFESTDVFGEWMKLNKIDLSSVSLLKEETKTFVQYMVFHSAAENIDEAKKNMEKIKELGISDAWLFEKGGFKGGISLGLYDREEPAKLRVEEIVAMGMDTEIKVIHRKKSALYSKVSTKDNQSKLVVFLSDNQSAIDCKIE